MKRAAMTQDELAAIILVVAVGLIVLTLVITLSKTGTRLRDEAACETSVDLASARVGGVRVLGDLVQLQCPSVNTIVKEDGVYESSVADPTGLQKTDITTEGMRRRLVNAGASNPTTPDALMEMAKYTIASEMATCWKEFGQGQKDPFKSSTLFSDDRCITCTVIQFDDSFRKAVNSVGVDNFTTYLKKTSYDQKISFYDYLRPQLEQLTTAGKVVVTAGTGLPGAIASATGMLEPENLPVNAYFLNANNKPEVQAVDTIAFNDPLVVTLMWRDTPFLIKWAASNQRAAVMAWPMEYRPSCDVLY